MSKAVDPLLISVLLSQGLRWYADIADRLAHGTITDEDINKMLSHLGIELDAWQAQVDAHQAAKP